MEQLKWDIVQRIFKMRPDELSMEAIEKIERQKEKELADLQLGGSVQEEPQVRTIKRDAPKVGRNDVCPCESGKKYKQCHGRE